ncbi:DUF2267 domain-containing protein [Streptomyces albus]|uniref:DUF2267 domain-containing protein n=1 Tax=Streptomyces albus TaxID=1888 RepID=A0A6C1C8C4_9ACTN|nr:MULTISPECIES: DUF2267 domain-containing protein [Streptomyces]KPC95080.1 hypothetical protein ADL27_09820 [Streptomyces sp. NRRL F-6602]EPD93033.1 hypothetical protein HMPREF1486_04110 [Streptomyces sp. HPH0547]MDI6409025.1 DUF2267 domain-containing protein [Streptomyces albus]QID39143.1 DUF2267 domain-containing protein [Streptomyces albus]TGG85642.1 DUF2267 domain-containing protein [Streptomyces albus]
MRYDEFLAQVRERGEYRDQQEAEQVTRAVLGVLATRITPVKAQELAAQLPGPLGPAVAEAGEEAPETFGVSQFCERVAEQTGARPRTAEWDASAVLSTLADAVSGGELNQLISQLPSGYATLFGKAELSR